MGLLSNLKAIAIEAAGTYTLARSPYEPFSRPFLPKELRSLKQREADCYSDLQNFWLDGEVLRSHVYLTSPGLEDLGDQATWHGIYSAMLSLKWSVTQSSDVATGLSKAIKGLNGHQTAHGEKRNRLIRGYDRANKAWQDDASNDTLTGHFVGLYFLLEYGPASVQKDAIFLIKAIADELCQNNFCLINADNKPTTYGKLIHGVLTDPLQMTLALAIMAVAYRVSPFSRFLDAHLYLYHQYSEMIPYAKASFGNYENWNDDHRAAIHLMILAKEGTDPVKRLAKQGLFRLWALYGQRANIWMNALIALGLETDLPIPIKATMRNQANQVLSEFDYMQQLYDIEFDYTESPVVDHSGFEWKPTIVNVKGIPRATQPLPLWAVGRQDFVWQRQRYTVKDWTGNKQASQRFNAGGAYLCAYWASRKAGLLYDDD